ncbi:MAG TPA: FAD-dependent oxidoreductase [Vicinamibacterales bacterium]|nr:FAD-dependent oxidoreductase [Vicinamibacterales bacterium]
MANAPDGEHPDLSRGVAAESVADGKPFPGRVGDDEVMVVRAEGQLFAVGAHCTHYKGPLNEGLVVGRTVRCPWHHAAFSLETGEALRAPALDPILRWRVEESNGRIFVHEKLAAPASGRPDVRPSSVVIVGGGAAGLAAADMLRREGYDGPVTMVSADADPPVDRPNLSKDYLAGEAQEDWLPLWPADFYTDRHIELLLGTRVASIDIPGRAILLEDGSRREYGALLLATGAEPVRIPVPGAADDLFYLRSFADSRAIIKRAEHARRVVVVGASFIGLEVAASLRARQIDVDVVAPEKLPLERIMGAEIGRFVQSLHESHGVTFHLGETVVSMSEPARSITGAAKGGRTVTLSGGGTIEADCIVMGVGVKPAIGLAERAGLAIDRGVSVDEYLESSVPGIFAAGDIARWPDSFTGDRIRVEHWVVAERQGQVAAKNILGGRERYDAIPFFWSQHYDVTIRYSGHAEKWDRVDVSGSLDAQDAAVSFLLGGKRLAIATISRDLENLKAEQEFERSSRRPAP